MPVALYPGSFDPPHRGHLDIIRRAAAACGQVVVAVARNHDKSSTHGVEQRLDWLRAMCAEVPGASVESYTGATVRFALSRGVGVLVRGLRNHADFEAEQAMATVNRAHGLDTLFLMTDPQHAHLSSRLVRMVLAAGLPISDLVPPIVERDLLSSR
jgi:pantetheine-phosphate adenylyltransferase